MNKYVIQQAMKSHSLQKQTLAVDKMKALYTRKQLRMKGEFRGKSTKRITVFQSKPTKIRINYTKKMEY